jgi:hypothetical protein
MYLLASWKRCEETVKPRCLITEAWLQALNIPPIRARLTWITTDHSTYIKGKVFSCFLSAHLHTSLRLPSLSYLVNRPSSVPHLRRPTRKTSQHDQTNNLLRPWRQLRLRKSGEMLVRPAIGHELHLREEVHRKYPRRTSVLLQYVFSLGLPLMILTVLTQELVQLANARVIVLRRRIRRW